MKRFCLALDLKDDPILIAEYEKYHEEIWPDIRRSILLSGIQSMQIYRLGNRLCMIMETNDEFSFSAKSTMDRANPKVQEWEELMWKYQKALPQAKPGEKWVPMDEIFSLYASQWAGTP